MTLPDDALKPPREYLPISYIINVFSISNLSDWVPQILDSDCKNPDSIFQELFQAGRRSPK